VIFFAAVNDTIYPQIEKLAKLIPVTLASAYVAGFLVVSFRLAEYGLSTLDLFKAQFIAAGLWYGLLSSSILLVYLPIRTAVTAPLIKRYRLSLPMMLGVSSEAKKVAEAFLATFVLGLIGLITRTATQGKFLHYVVGLLLAETFIRVWIFCRARQKLGMAMFFELYFSLLLVALCIALTIATFGTDVYSKIPFVIGGGSTRRVVFWLSRTPAVTEGHESFLEKQPGTDYTIPYELLNENENSFVVISPRDGQRSIEFDRKAVEAMIVLRRPQSASATNTQPTPNPPAAKNP
jgi:hypothetical protein